MKQFLVHCCGLFSDTLVAPGPARGTVFRGRGTAALLVGTALFLGGCEGDGPLICTDNWVYGINVHVEGGALDPKSGSGDFAPLPDPMGGAGGMGSEPGTGGTGSVSTCHAQVIATEGAFEEELVCMTDGADCDCYGVGERAGTYTVKVIWGDSEQSKNVTVTEDECHVIPENLNFSVPESTD